MARNALILASELAERKEWADAWKVCKEYLDCEDKDDIWEPLDLEEQEKVTLLRIECIIKSIALEKFSTGKVDDNNIVIWNEKYDVFVEELWDAIIEGLAEQILSAGDITENRNKIEKYFTKVEQMAKEHYLFMLDDVIDHIKPSKNVTKTKFFYYFDGYIGITQIIVMQFTILAKKLEIEDYNFDRTNFHEAISYQEDKLFNRCLEISQMITESTNDFPYYYDYDISYMYLAALYLVDQSIPEKSDLDKNNVRISRLKHKVNLICDFLNAIYVSQGERVSLCLTEMERNRQYNEMIKCEKEIKELESDYSHPEVNKERFSTFPENKNPIVPENKNPIVPENKNPIVPENKNNPVPKRSSGGCYIATAVYGSYDCPQVWTLRRYRDCILAETWHGRAFIKTYYAISPALVKWFGHTEWFKKMWQGKLDRMVAKLQANGVESAPYEDRKWK